MHQTGKRYNVSMRQVQMKVMVTWTQTQTLLLNSAHVLWEKCSLRWLKRSLWASRTTVRQKPGNALMQQHPETGGQILIALPEILLPKTVKLNSYFGIRSFLVKTAKDTKTNNEKLNTPASSEGRQGTLKWRPRGRSALRLSGRYRILFLFIHSKC